MEQKQEIKKEIAPEKAKISAARKGIEAKPLMCLVGVLAFAGGILFAYQALKGSFDFTLNRKIEITAHRGASSVAPENTMSAFRKAKEQRADWIELDVQQTKDHKIVVSHDSNTMRMAGADMEINETNYEDLAKLDFGSKFSKDYAGEKIPLLSEVLEFAKKEGISLNIEIKPNGPEVDFEKDVVDLVNEANMRDNVVVTSLVYEVLERVKEADSDIRTVYVMALAYGDLSPLSKADDFSIEETYATRDLADKIHREGKKLLVWTVDKEDGMIEAARNNVDNIITDDVPLAQKVLKENFEFNF